MDEKLTKDSDNSSSVGMKIEVRNIKLLVDLGNTLQSIISFLVIVPSNPENSYF
jgi:hypothetical protein